MIDLSQKDDVIIQQLMDAFTTIGFCTLINHSDDTSFIENAFSASKHFFQLPLDTKQKYAYTSQESNRGYIAYGQETHDQFGTVLPDVKETFDIGVQKVTIVRDHQKSSMELRCQVSLQPQACFQI